MENNNQDIKLCPSCGAKNKSAYKYCNECGAALNPSSYANPTPENIPPQSSPYGTSGSYYGNQYSQNSYTPNYIPYGVNMYSAYASTPDFNGVSAKDIYEFTGEKPKLFNKLRAQHFSGKTGPYCWPLFTLGLIFSLFGMGLGFFAMGCWYLYHKMYKPATGLFVGAAVDFAINIYSLVTSLNYTLNNFTPEIYNSIQQSIYGNGSFAALYDIMASGHPMAMLLSEVASTLSFASLVLAIVLPFFAYGQYKNFAIKKIRAEYNLTAQPQFTLKGGTKGGLVGVIATIYGFVIFAIVFSVMSWFLTGMYQKGQDYPKNNSGDGYYQQTPFGDDFDDFFDFDEHSEGLW